MANIDKIITKLTKIQLLLSDIARDLENLKIKGKSAKTHKDLDDKLPTERDCELDFNNLYTFYDSGNVKAIDDYVKRNSIAHLKVFCRANKLSVDVKKAGKQKLIDEIRQWFAQRKALE